MMISVRGFEGITRNLKLVAQLSFVGERIKPGSFMETDNSLQKTRPTVGVEPHIPGLQPPGTGCCHRTADPKARLAVEKQRFQGRGFSAALQVGRAPVPQAAQGHGQCRHGLGASLLPPGALPTPLSPHTACSFILLQPLCFSSRRRLAFGVHISVMTPVDD